ncbi:MAG: VCBS repeat-containing protein, partial [Lysobacter sp.]|nr:VCBS repeat-containing protein [Lysobacter sp.]
AWAQTRFQDSTGNYIDFLYLENPSGAGTGEQLISEVRYTGKTLLPGQSGSALAPYAKVVFSYSSRGSAAGKAYVAGGALTQSQRLESITSCATGAAGACATETQARFYQLGYATTVVVGSMLERLLSVQECRDSTKAVCLPATTFAWSQANPGSFDTQETSGSIPNGSLSKFDGLKFGDVDGDGRMDLIWLKDGQRGETCSSDLVYVAFARIDSTGKPFFTVGNPVLCTPAELAWDPADGSWFLLDYDGDGRDDLFLRGQTQWLGYRSNGDATNPFVESDMLAELAQPIPAGATRDAEPQHADVNGDGLIDLVYSTGTGLVVRVMERGGSYGYRWGNARAITLTTDTCTSNCFTLSGLYRKNNYQQLNDFDGDSRSDLLVNVEGTCDSTGDPPPQEPTDPIHVQSTDTTDGTTTATTCPRMMPFVVDNLTATSLTLRRYGTVAASLAEGYSFADLNGDGLSDMIGHGLTTGIPGFSINTGVGFVTGGNLGFGVTTSQVQAVDANGDGRADIVYTSSDYSHFVARYGRANGTVSDAVALPNLTTGCGALECFGSRSFLFTDVDADGNVDFMRIKWDDSSSPVYFSRASAANRQLPRDAITQVTNGLGAQTLITYAPLTNNAVYRADSGSRNASAWGRGSPVQDLKAPMYVVAKAASSSPQAGLPAALATVHYRYAGAKVQAGGRGLLGFREIVTIDPNQSGGYVTTQTLYHQQFPLTGMPAQTFKRAVAGSAYAVPACLNGVTNDSCYSTPGSAFPAPAGSLFTENSHVWESDTEVAGTAVTAYSAGVQAPVHVRTAGTIEKLRDPFYGAPTSRVETSFSYTAYGNVAATSVDTFHGDDSTAMSTVITSNT